MAESERLYRRRRAELVEDLRERGITDECVLAAIGRVPRHKFFKSSALRHRAYYDEALPIGFRQTISQPFTVAYQTMLLNPCRGERILEVGTGSGYQAAVLCEMGAHVFSIERHKDLLLDSREVLHTLGYRVVTRNGDGTHGWSACAPFDGIIVTAAAAEVPEALLEQLKSPQGPKPGGRLIIPVGDSDGQIMTRIVRVDAGKYEVQELESFRFVPLVSG